MSKAKRKKRKAAPPPKPVAKKKVPRKAAPAAAPRHKPGGAGIQAGKIFTGWFARLPGEGYTSRDWARLAFVATGLLVVLLLYSFSAGGYFIVRRSYGELVILWLIVVGLLFELQVRGRMPRSGMVELGIFGGYTAWILLSVIWSLAPAKSFDEFVRGLLYVSGFALFYLYMGRREWLGWLGHLFVAVVAIVAIDSLIGKTLPDVLTHPDPFQSNRLNYPITYWNTMALFMVMGFVIGLRTLADRVTHIAVRCIYAPAMFLFLVVLWFTFSRAGLLLLAASIGLYLLLAVTRLRAVLQTGLLGTWTAIVVFVSYRFLPNMVASVPNQTLKVSEGHKLALLILIIISAASVSQFVIRMIEDRVTVTGELGRRIGYGLAGALVFFLAAAFIVFTSTGGRGGPFTFVGDQLSAFGTTEREAAVERPSERLFSLQSERFQEYNVSLERFAEYPLQGTGAATWSIAWLKYRPWDIQVKDGHSWFFETLAELGLVGALLLVGFATMFFVVSIKDLRFLGKSRERELYGAFFVACTAFLAHSMIDWDWEMPVVTLTFFMFAGGLLRYGQLARVGAEGDAAKTETALGRNLVVSWLGRRWNWLLGAGCILAMIAVIIPLIAATRIQAANRLAQKQDYAGVEREAKLARRLNPLDADPLVLQALAKQGQGKLNEAEALLVEAADKEPENDRIWRNLSRIYVQMNDVDKAVFAIMRTRALNPLESKETGDLEVQIRQMGGKF